MHGPGNDLWLSEEWVRGWVVDGRSAPFPKSSLGSSGQQQPSSVITSGSFWGLKKLQSINWKWIGSESEINRYAECGRQGRNGRFHSIHRPSCTPPALQSDRPDPIECHLNNNVAPIERTMDSCKLISNFMHHVTVFYRDALWAAV